jgi:hypothetical protein
MTLDVLRVVTRERWATHGQESVSKGEDCSRMSSLL